MSRTHILTVKTNCNLKIQSPRMIIPQDAMLDVFDENGAIMVSLGGRFQIELCLSKDGFDDYLKRKIFKIVKVQLTRLEADA